LTPKPRIKETAMRAFAILSFAVVMSLPNLSPANGPPVPAPLYYLRLADKNKADDMPKKIVRIDENVPIALSYRSDLARPRLVVPQKYADVKAPAKAGLGGDLPAGRTALAGLTLSAAFVSGGFWLLRRNSKAAKSLLVLFFFSSGLFFSHFLADLSSNEAAPPRQPKALEALKIAGTTANLGIDVIIVPEGDRIQLVLPKHLLPVTMVPEEEFNKKPGFPRMGLVPEFPDPKADGKKKDKGSE
jgi:hypothetical protein